MKTSIKSKPCPECNDTGKVFEVEREEADKFIAGAHIQDAFPNMPADERERFISGICPTCWNKMFAMDEEEEL